MNKGTSIWMLYALCNFSIKFMTYFLSKKMLVIRIIFSICSSIWMVAKGFSRTFKPIGWWQKCSDHPSTCRSLDGHWRFFATIQPYLLHIWIVMKGVLRPFYVQTDADHKHFKFTIFSPLEIWKNIISHKGDAYQ